MKTEEELSTGNKVAVEFLFNIDIPDEIWAQCGVEIAEMTHECLELIKAAKAQIKDLIKTNGCEVKRPIYH